MTDALLTQTNSEAVEQALASPPLVLPDFVVPGKIGNTPTQEVLRFCAQMLDDAARDLSPANPLHDMQVMAGKLRAMADAATARTGPEGSVPRALNLLRDYGTAAGGDADDTALLAEAWIELDYLTEDAARWRALMTGGRLEFFGSAGLDNHGRRRDTSDPYVHFGLNLWSAYAADDNVEKSDWARQALISFTDGVRQGTRPEDGERAVEERERQYIFDRAIIIGRHGRLCLHRLLAGESIALSEVDFWKTLEPTVPDRMIAYLIEKKLIEAWNDGGMLTAFGRQVAEVDVSPVVGDDE